MLFASTCPSLLVPVLGQFTPKLPPQKKVSEATPAETAPAPIVKYEFCYLLSLVSRYVTQRFSLELRAALGPIGKTDITATTEGETEVTVAEGKGEVAVGLHMPLR